MIVMERLSATPFDDVFRTECVKLKEYLIPLINEIYGTEFTMRSDIQLHENEQMHSVAVDSDDPDKQGIPKKITDLSVSIDGHYYHMECQSTEDDSILIRIVEYDMYIAVRSAVYDPDLNVLVVPLPHSAVVYLRRKEEKSPLQVIYQYEDQMIQTTVPVISAQKYSIEEIFEKELYFLLPYYFMRYEKEFKKGIGLSDDRIVRDMDQIHELLYKCQENERLSEHDARYIMDLLLIVLKAVTRNMEDSEKRRLMRYMGGQVLELETDRIDAAIEKGTKLGKSLGIALGIEEGRKEGRAEGREEGRESMTLRATESLLEKMNPEEALEQLQWLFRISRSEAEKYIKQFV